MIEKTKSKIQYAALPFRRRSGDALEILLITSRGTRRWVIPKGWPLENLAPHKSAAHEAREEAGVRGRISKVPSLLSLYEAIERRLNYPLSGEGLCIGSPEATALLAGTKPATNKVVQGG